MIKRSTGIVCLALAALLASGCSSSKNTVPRDRFDETESTLQKREKDLQDKTIEMLDLKNQIIILQSELADLKDNIIDLKTRNDSLSFSLVQEKNESKVLSEKLDEVDMEKTKLLQNNSALTKKIADNNDSLKTVLEVAARQNYETNILQALDEPAEAGKTVKKETAAAAKPTNTVAQVKKPEEKKLKKELDTAIKPVMNLTKEEYQQRYQEALKLYFANNFKDAIKEFSALLDIDRSNDYSDNCQYWIAESYYSQGQYEKALAEFKKVQTYKDSNKLDAALFKSGLCNIRLNRKNEGLRDFQTLIETYPKSTLVAKVKDMLKSGSF